MTSNDALNQVARTSDCPNCGHCVELYTPAEGDDPALVETRDMIRTWVQNLLADTKKDNQSEFLQ